MAEQRDAFLREVDEELRKEQLLRFWQKYGLAIVAVAALALVGAIGWQWSKHRAQGLAEAAGTRFETAARGLGDAPSEEALKTFAAMAADAPAGYRALARFRVAAEHLKAQRPAQALAEYEAIGADRTGDPILRDYAVLQAAMLRMDTAEWTEMENRLNPLVSGSSPWRPAAREALALAAMKAGRTDVARKQLEGLLGDRAATPGMIERANLLLTALTDQEPAKPRGAAATGSDTKPEAAPATTAPKK